MGIPMFKIRRSRDRLIFNMGIPILLRWHLYIEMAPWYHLMQLIHLRVVLEKVLCLKNKILNESMREFLKGISLFQQLCYDCTSCLLCLWLKNGLTRHALVTRKHQWTGSSLQGSHTLVKMKFPTFSRPFPDLKTNFPYPYAVFK